MHDAIKTQSLDTHPAAERVQIELLRQATVARRFALVRSLSKMAMQLSWRALRRAHPQISDQEVDLAFVELHYGPDLADKLRQYLAKRQA